MEYVKCILCNVNDTSLLVKKNFCNIVKCNRCGLVYLNPRLNEFELTQLYNIPPGSTIEKITVSQRDARHETHKIQKFKIAIQLLKNHKRNIENVFDLGCATGIFLAMATKEGWTAYGTDVNVKLIDKNKKKYSGRVKLQIGTTIDFPDRYFDVVTLFDTIEHLPDPIATLREASRVLKNYGLIVITTPNIDGFFPKFTYALFGKTIGAWEHPTPPGHVYQFSKKTLRKTIEKADLEWVDFRNFEIDMNYTVGQLENSIINVLKKNSCNRRKPDRDTWSNEAPKYKNNNMSVIPFYFLKKLPRLLIRGFCWGLVAIIYPIARLANKGDSMVVIGRKVRQISGNSL